MVVYLSNKLTCLFCCRLQFVYIVIVYVRFDVLLGF